MNKELLCRIGSIRLHILAKSLTATHVACKLVHWKLSSLHEPHFNTFSDILNKLMFVVSSYNKWKWRNLCYSCYVVCCISMTVHPHYSPHPALHRNHLSLRVYNGERYKTNMCHDIHSRVHPSQQWIRMYTMVRSSYYIPNMFIGLQRWETMEQVLGHMQQSAFLTAIPTDI